MELELSWTLNSADKHSFKKKTTSIFNLVVFISIRLSGGRGQKKQESQAWATAAAEQFPSLISLFCSFSLWPALSLSTRFLGSYVSQIASKTWLYNLHKILFYYLSVIHNNSRFESTCCFSFWNASVTRRLVVFFRVCVEVRKKVRK